MAAQLARGENVVLLANHQTEADPAVSPQPFYAYPGITLPIYKPLSESTLNYIRCLKLFVGLTTHNLLDVVCLECWGCNC